MSAGPEQTVWVLGDQLDRRAPTLRDAEPAQTRVLLVTSTASVTGRAWHRQRLHAVLASMARFAAALRAEGFEVDERRAPTLAEGLEAHRAELRPRSVRAVEPTSWDAMAMMRRQGVELVRSEAFLCHRELFARWAGERPGRLRMEDFYRWQRRRLGYLMDADQPAGGRWNHDGDNRLPPPRDGRRWPEPVLDHLDGLDAEIVASLPQGCVGDPPSGWWPTDRAGALERLERFVSEGLASFGPYEDAMLAGEARLAHSGLSQALNLGLLHPSEVCDAVELAYRAGKVPIASAEGMLRQVIGWREYVWGLYWLWMPEYRDCNALDARRALPPAFTGAPTAMRCVSITVAGIVARGWVHHIQRLMVLGNLALLAGVEPRAMVEWMQSAFVDGAEWVMLPNLVGMALHADGGRMATKPYAAGGAYINRMSDYCKGCAFDPRQRTGERACPYTTLYWDFLDRHRQRLARNPRTAQQVRGLDRLADLPEVRRRAGVVLDRLDSGEL